MRNLNNCNTKNHCFFTWILTYMPLIVFVALQYHYFNTFFKNIAKVINCLYKNHIRLLDTYAAKIREKQTPFKHVIYVPLNHSAARPISKNLHALFRPSDQNVKRMFTFEKWPLATQLEFKTYENFGHFEFQLCHLRSLFKHTFCTHVQLWSFGKKFWKSV